MKLSASLATLTALLFIAREPAAEPLINEARHFSLDIPAGLQSEPAGTALHRFKGAAGVQGVVSLVDFPNLPAYWRDDKSDFFAGLARGVAQSTNGYRLKSKQDRRVGGTPVYDLHFERSHDKKRELVWMRFVLYRRFAIVATATSPLKAPRKTRKLAEALVSSLAPYTSAAE